jgi:hypothetical protein
VLISNRTCWLIGAFLTNENSSSWKLSKTRHAGWRMLMGGTTPGRIYLGDGCIPILQPPREQADSGRQMWGGVRIFKSPLILSSSPWLSKPRTRGSHTAVCFVETPYPWHDS